MTTEKTGTLHPVARGLAAVIAVIGTLLDTSALGAAVAWIAVLMPLIFLAGILRQYLRFVVTILTPISIALFIVWGWIVGAPPGAAINSSPVAGVEFATLIVLRLALLGGIAQLCFSTIPSHRLVHTLQSWGVRGDGLVIAISSLTLVPEMQLRAEQVLTARYARGFVRNRKLVTKLQQVPHLLRPLMAWVLRSAIQRGEIWNQRRLIARMEEKVSYRDISWLKSGVLVLVAMAWLVYGICTRILMR